MGKRGPKPSGAKKMPTEVSTATGLRPTTGMTARARTAWKQVVASFPGGHFTEADRVLLEEFCEAVAIHRAATALLQKEGRYYWDERGVRRRHPAADDQRQARCDCAMLATKLRITKQAVISPKAAGRAVQNAEEESRIHEKFGDLLFSGDGVRQ